MPTPLNLSDRASNRGASAAPVVLGVLAAGVVGLVAWRVMSADPFQDNGEIGGANESPVAVVEAPTSAAALTAQDILDRMAAAEQARVVALEADAPTAPPETGSALADLVAKLNKPQLEQMITNGNIEMSDEARERLEAGLVIPSHWYRVVGDRVRVADPGAVSPGYAAIEAPLVPVVMIDGPGLPDHGIWRGKPVVKDLDGDGSLEIVASLRMWQGGQKGEGLHVWTKRDGTWVEKTSGMSREMGYGGADCADLDGDGRLDLAFGCHNGYPRAFLANGLDADPAWTEVSLGLEEMGVCADIALADYTGDGVPELACVGLFSGTGGLYVYSYDREKRAWFILSELLGPNEFGYQVRSADIDGDGQLELIATTNQGVRVYSWRDGAFADRSAGLVAPVVGGSLLQVLPRDLDGDGVCELFVAGWHNEQGLPITIYKLVDGVWQDFGVELPETESINDAEFAELDGDPNPEIFMLAKEGMLLGEFDEKGVFSIVARIGGPEPLYHTEVCDLDGDGLDEAVVVKRGGVVLLDLPATWARATKAN